MKREWNFQSAPVQNGARNGNPWLQIPRIYTASSMASNVPYCNDHRDALESLNLNSISHRPQNKLVDKIKDTYKVRKHLQLAFAEFVGSAIMIYVGCLGCNPLAFGMAALVPVQIFGHISGGHFNIAVTIAALIVGKLHPKIAPIYFAGQFLGVFAGYALLYVGRYHLVFSHALIRFILQYTAILDTKRAHCITGISEVGAFQGMMVELVMTMILVLVLCSLWEKKFANKGETAPIKIGLTVLGLVSISAKVTGGSFNSLRSFVPAIYAGYWENHWIYWIGPNLGAVIGALIYRFLIKNRPWES